MSGEMLDHALAYADMGWAVLPLHTVDHDRRCSCQNSACNSAGKHPVSKQGLSDATTDVRVITRWWSRVPTANIGIACEKSGLIVVDIDPRNAGFRNPSSVRWRERRPVALDMRIACSCMAGALLVF